MTPPSKAPRAQPQLIPAPQGNLEGLLEWPADLEPIGAALVCHPHPLYGGTMHNKVAHTLARTFVRAGFVALRFNFRGVGNSDGAYDEGEGECDDAVAAWEWLSAQGVQGPHWLSGFSFGAAIAIRAALQVEASGLVSVAPAVARFATGLEDQPRCPWLVVQGDEDELVAVDDTVEWLDGLEPGPELQIIEGAEHFFHGRLVDLREVVANFVAEASAQ
ncbi:MAG: alpha/beta hydrolase [Pseudomonadota bacterium]